MNDFKPDMDMAVRTYTTTWKGKKDLRDSGAELHLAIGIRAAPDWLLRARRRPKFRAAHGTLLRWVKNPSVTRLIAKDGCKELGDGFDHFIQPGKHLKPNLNQAQCHCRPQQVMKAGGAAMCKPGDSLLANPVNQP